MNNKLGPVAILSIFLLTGAAYAQDSTGDAADKIGGFFKNFASEVGKKLTTPQGGEPNSTTSDSSEAGKKLTTAKGKGSNSAPGDATESKKAPASIAFQGKLADLEKQRADNGMRFDAKYRDQMLIVSGYMFNVGKRAHSSVSYETPGSQVPTIHQEPDSVYLKMVSSPDTPLEYRIGKQVVHCDLFDEAAMKMMMQISKGQPLIVQGIYRPREMPNDTPDPRILDLLNCTLASAK